MPRALGTKSHAGALPYKTKSKTKRMSKPEPAHAVSTVTQLCQLAMIILAVKHHGINLIRWPTTGKILAIRRNLERQRMPFRGIRDAHDGRHQTPFRENQLRIVDRRDPISHGARPVIPMDKIIRTRHPLGPVHKPVRSHILCGFRQLAQKLHRKPCVHGSLFLRNLHIVRPQPGEVITVQFKIHLLSDGAPKLVIIRLHRKHMIVPSKTIFHLPTLVGLSQNINIHNTYIITN